MYTIFTPDLPTSNSPQIIQGGNIQNARKTITASVSDVAKKNGDAFALEIRNRFVADFEKAEQDKMVHVSTFLYTGGKIYMSYYANTQDSAEDPGFQTARLAYCPADDPKNQTILDIQTVGDKCYDGIVEKVYDTILMQKDENTLFVLWTAAVSGKYYRLYRVFDLRTGTLGSVQVNRFKVGDVVNDFSTTGIQNALTANKIGYKTMFSDIGIMQKLSCRMENGIKYYYTGTYSGAFTAIIKSHDLITWEYVSQPDFINDSKWENATYVCGDRCYYFVRQFDEESNCGFLTVFDLVKNTWEAPVLIEDCQSRSDFIVYKNELYLFHAPIDREHIGIIHINQSDIALSEVVLQADMGGSCFYPFVQYTDGDELGMSYTIDRKHIRLSKFDFEQYL